MSVQTNKPSRAFRSEAKKDRLVRYCIHKEIEILDVLQEDHSAKTFNRPVWSALLAKIRKNTGQRPNLILLTKWDRFSRNVGDAYYMISQLQKFGIQPQATDQELDFAVPENKIILAVYLAASEAENERRSLNVKHGIRKAKQEGRWIAHVPIGYKATVTMDGHKSICPQEPEATFIRRAFVLASRDDHPILPRTKRQIGEITFYSNLIRQELPIELLICTEDGIKIELIKGQEIIDGKKATA